MPMNFYTYMYVDPRTNVPFYVGKGTRNRAYRHGKNENRSKAVLGRIQKLNDIGLKHIVEITDLISEEDAIWFEIDLIRSLGRKDIGTGCLLNFTDGGDGVSGIKWSDERKAAKSFQMQGRIPWIAGRKHSDESKAKQKAAKLGKPGHNLGYRHTDESRAKMSASKMGTKNAAKLSEEDVAKILMEFVAGNSTQQLLADQYGISREAVSAIVNNRTWKHIPRPVGHRES